MTICLSLLRIWKNVSIEHLDVQSDARSAQALLHGRCIGLTNGTNIEVHPRFLDGVVEGSGAVVGTPGFIAEPELDRQRTPTNWQHLVTRQQPRTGQPELLDLIAGTICQNALAIQILRPTPNLLA